jgi:hypothetical protein
MLCQDIPNGYSLRQLKNARSWRDGLKNGKQLGSKANWNWRGEYRLPTYEMTLEKIVQKIDLFEQQNPGLRVRIIVRRRPEVSG